jgi:hypothetical protein
VVALLLIAVCGHGQTARLHWGVALPLVAVWGGCNLRSRSKHQQEILFAVTVTTPAGVLVAVWLQFESVALLLSAV